MNMQEHLYVSRGHKFVVTFAMEMDAPESLERFRELLMSHFTQIPRFTSRKMPNENGDGSYHHRQVTDET